MHRAVNNTLGQPNANLQIKLSGQVQTSSLVGVVALLCDVEMAETLLDHHRRDVEETPAGLLRRSDVHMQLKKAKEKFLSSESDD